MKYVFRENYRAPTGLDAETVATSLESIRAQHGGLKPAGVVEASRPKTAPLHPAFEWKDKEAAERYREWQARSLIRAVKVIESPKAEPMPVFVHVNPEGKPASGYYQATEIAVRRPDEWASAVAHLAGKMASAEASLHELRQIAANSGNDTAGLIVIAAQALATARDAVNQLRH